MYSILTELKYERFGSSASGKSVFLPSHVSPWTYSPIHHHVVYPDALPRSPRITFHSVTGIVFSTNVSAGLGPSVLYTNNVLQKVREIINKSSPLYS